MTTGTMLGVGPGHLAQAFDGQTVTYSLPSGCVLRRSVNGVGGEIVDTPSPFIHVGAPMYYRLDCDIYDGTPMQATLEITG